MIERLEIAIAVVEYANQFLIGPRPAESALAGLWEFPGGKIEPGEAPADAAIRECREESGLTIQIRGPYPTEEFDYAHGSVRLHFFDCFPTQLSTPYSPFRWVARQELLQYSFPAGNSRLLELLTTSKSFSPDILPAEGKLG